MSARGPAAPLVARPRAVALAGALALALAAPEARAFCRSTTRRSATPGECSQRGQPLAWQSRCVSFSLFLDGSPEVPTDVLRVEAEDAALKWYRVGCDANGRAQPYLQLLRIGDTTNPSGYNARGVNANSVSFNEVWALDAMHRRGTIAITVVTFDSFTGEILDADIEMNQLSEANPEGFSFTVGVPDPSAADLPTILTHEFGHFLGLSHSIDDSAVMWPEAGLGEQRRQPLVDDVRGICTIYNPELTPERECNLTPYGGFARDPVGGRVIGTACAVAPTTPGLAHAAPPAPRSTRTYGTLGLALAVASAVTVALRGRRSRD